MAPEPTLRIQPAAYGAAAKKCYDLATAIGAAFDPLYQTLYDSAGMAGNYPQVKDWANAYDGHVAEFVTMATTLANAVQNIGDVLAFTGYNYALAENLNIDPTTGVAIPSPPDEPPVSSPLYGGDEPVLTLETVIGNRGSGITTNIPGLIADIAIPVPNGDTTLLKNAADAWHTFAGHNTVTTASETLKGISATLTADVQAPDLDHFADHFTTLANGANDLLSAAAALAPLVTAHHDQLSGLRTQIQSDTDGLLVALGAIAVAAATAMIVSTIFSGGLSLVGVDEAEGGAATEAGMATIARVGATISGEISAFVSTALAGAAAAFSGITTLSATGLAAIAALSVVTLASDSAAGGMSANASTKPPKNAYDPNGPKAPGRPDAAEGYYPPKGGDAWVRTPRGYGWEDADGRVWVPTGPEGSPNAHGGPHWDVQDQSGGGYENIYPGGNTR